MTRQHKAQHKKEKAQHKTGIGTRQDKAQDMTEHNKTQETRLRLVAPELWHWPLRQGSKPSKTRSSGTYPPQF